VASWYSIVALVVSISLLCFVCIVIFHYNVNQREIVVYPHKCIARNRRRWKHIVIIILVVLGGLKFVERIIEDVIVNLG